MEQDKTSGQSDYFIIAASFDRLSFKKDGTLSLGLGTYILAEDQKQAISSMYGQSGFLMFKTGEITPDEEDMIKNIDADLQPNKSKSQRLRAVLYRVWEKEFAKHCTFDTYYMNVMEELIEKYKERLN